MQVRVRRKNPLIDRPITDQGREVETRASPEVPEEAPPEKAKRPPRAEPPEPEPEPPRPTRAPKVPRRVEAPRAPKASRPGAAPRSNPRAAPASPVVIARATVPSSLPRFGQEDEDTNTTQELELVEGGLRRRRRTRSRSPVPVPVASLLDEDRTELATPRAPVATGRSPSPKRSRAGEPTREVPRATVRREVEGAVPRELLGKWGTDAIGAEAQRAHVERLAEDMSSVDSPALRVLRGELAPDELACLGRALAGELDQPRLEASLSPKRSLEHLINENAFNELSASERARILKAIAVEPRDIATIKSAIAILKTGVAKRLRSDERDMLLRVFLGLDSEARALLARLAARPLRGLSALEDRDLEDTSLVVHLHTLVVDRPLARDVESRGIERARVLALLIGSIANPERLPFEEGGDGVLGMFEYGLADCSPAELARIWTQLAMGEMVAELAGEERLDLGARVRGDPSFTFTARDTPLRVGLEQVVALAHPRGGADREAFVMPGGHGVDADVVSRALSMIYGTGFTVAAGAPTAMRHLSRVPRDPQRAPPVFVTLLYDRGERLFLFDHFDDDGVLLRAPHGRSTKRRGAQRVDPLRTVEDPELGLDRVSREELEALIGVALVPRP